MYTILMVILLLVASPCLASPCLASPCLVEVPFNFFAWGAGNESCGTWTETKHRPVHYQYLQWVEGFISGVNYVCRDQQARPLDDAAIVVFIDHYCTNNPLHPILKAATVLVQETGGPKVIFPPPPRQR